GSGNPPPVASEFFVKADVYVLAAGAVEDDRLLLLSHGGNSSGAVGVSFMAHPLSSGAIGTSGSYLNPAQTNLLNGFDARTGRRWSNANGVTVAGRLVAR